MSQINKEILANNSILNNFLTNPSNSLLTDLKQLSELDYKEYLASQTMGKLNLIQFLCVTNGLACLQHLAQVLPKETLQGLIIADEYKAFVLAAKVHLPLLQYLVLNLPEKLQEMIAANDYLAFLFAAGRGNLDILKYLEEKAPTKLPEMIAASGYLAFQCAASAGHLEVLKYLAEKAPDKLQEMISASNYQAFQWATEQGHLDIVKFLVEKAPASFKNMIATNNYASFKVAINNCDYAMLHFFLQQDNKLAAHFSVTEKKEFNTLLGDTSLLHYQLTPLVQQSEIATDILAFAKRPIFFKPAKEVRKKNINSEQLNIDSAIRIMG